MKNAWRQRGNVFTLQETASQIGRLPVGIYQLQHDDLTGFYLEAVGEGFTLPARLYGLETAFIDRVFRKWETLRDGNLGVLLNGIRGTGKTVTAKQIANRAALPVVLVNRFYAGMTDYLQQFDQDFVLFIDEFEKLMADREEGEIAALLTFMDGVHNAPIRRLFLLTSNALSINENFTQRPGRIRYVKNFARLGETAVREIVADLLRRPEYEEDLLATLARCDLLTIDVVFGLTDEVNIHDRPASELFAEFNAEAKVSYFTITRRKVEDDRLGDPEYIGRHRRCSHEEFDADSIGDLFSYGNKWVGCIEDVYAADTALVQEGVGHGGGGDDEEHARYLYTVEPSPGDGFGAPVWHPLAV